MVALDLLPSICTSSEGLDFLASQKHIHWLAEACTASSDSVEEVIRGQCLSAVANVLLQVERARHPFKSSETYTNDVLPAFFRGIEIALDHSDEINRSLGLSAIGMFATASPSAFRAVLSCDALIERWLEFLRGQPSLQGATLHCLAKVLLFPSEPVEDQPLIRHQQEAIKGGSHQASGQEADQTPLKHVPPAMLQMLQEEGDQLAQVEDLCNRKKDLFDRIGAAVGGSRGISSMEHMMKLVKQPISEVKLAALDVLRSLAYQETPWGLHKLIGHAGFYSYLVDRTTEYTKEGKIWKFSLITAISRSPHASLLSSDVSTHIDLMLHQGPFFMPPLLEEPMTEEL